MRSRFSIHPKLPRPLVLLCTILTLAAAGLLAADELELGREVSVTKRLADGEEFEMGYHAL
ncbi:MAG: hypothetical protein MI919_08435, partial [Holophagales bacterium]|nr:hypothetical protein [Holophagales bacterium]